MSRHVARLGRVAALLSTAALALPSSVPTPALAPSTVFSAGFSADFAAVLAPGPVLGGSNLWWTDQDAALWTERWDELGLSLARVPVLHTLIEPSNDNANPTVAEPAGFRLDDPIAVPGLPGRTLTHRQWFTALRDRPGTEVLLHFGYLAPWLSGNPPHTGGLAAPYPPNDLDEYREFVTVVLRYLVDELGFPPQRLLVEVTNEPDLGCGQDPEVPCFWRDWTADDLLGVVRVTWQAAQSVDTRIRLVGLAECCGTGLVRALLDGYPEGAYLDGLSYHFYAWDETGLQPALDRAADLAPYGLPLYLDEYGSLDYLSEGIPGALWHSLALSTLACAGIVPVQYPVSELPGHPEPYNHMGLFRDWSGGWERKPAYWVYANFNHLLVGQGSDQAGSQVGSEIVAHSAPTGSDVLAVRRAGDGAARLVFWVTNGDTALPNQTFAVYNYPGRQATLRVYDNLGGPAPVLTAGLEGQPLTFTASLPAYSSFAFSVEEETPQAPVDRVILNPESATRAASQPISYTLTAYGSGGGRWDVTASGVYSVAAGAGGRWSGATYTPAATGTWTVTAAYAGCSDHATLTVRPLSGRVYLPLVLRKRGAP